MLSLLARRTASHFTNLANANSLKGRLFLTYLSSGSFHSTRFVQEQAGAAVTPSLHEEPCLPPTATSEADGQTTIPHGKEKVADIRKVQEPRKTEDDRVPYWQGITRWKNISEKEFLTHSWQVAKNIQGEKKLYEFLNEVLPDIIPPSPGLEHIRTREDFIEDVKGGIEKAPMAIRLTPHILSVIDWANPLADPIRRQFIPMLSTSLPDHERLELDSLHETDDSPVEGLVHRYTDKALFLAVSVCPLYCRFCTRSYSVGANTGSVQKKSFKPMLKRWESMLEYIKQTPVLQDIVVSGGDSYYLTPDQLGWLGEKLLDIPHIRRFRFATKGIAVSPSRILDPQDDWTDQLIRISRLGRERGKAVAVHTHFNHPHEFTWVTRAAAQKLYENGVVVRNQSVLLKGVNDNVQTMSTLIRELANNNIQPGDMVKGVEDLRTPLRTILDLEQQIRGSIAGFMTPQFVVDLPGGGGKRLAASYQSYDRKTGVSKFVAPAVKGLGKENRVYEYHDPTASLYEYKQSKVMVHEPLNPTAAFKVDDDLLFTWTGHGCDDSLENRPLHSTNADMTLARLDIDLDLQVPFYSSTTLCSSTSDLYPSTTSPRTLYAQTFDRPDTSRSLPRRKNMKDFTRGFATSEEEFEALPLSIRRKYFSTLERLRFAQTSRINTLNELPIQKNRKTSIADRRGLNVPAISPQRRNSSRRLRKASRQSSVSSVEASWFLTLPDKIKRKEFSREEQVVLESGLRENIILDAADEAILRRAGHNQPIVVQPPTPSTAETHSDKYKKPAMVDTLYESFRWMDEEEDLDLKLVFDDYHANLDGVVLPSPTSVCRPSFRRQMSISKMPFGGRSSLSSVRPRSQKQNDDTVQSHNRQKSRALSLIAPKHPPNKPTPTHQSLSTIDPNATHYQDPEARLKLRVYLASPQKFDEAIEFGFPSKDGMIDPEKENKPPSRPSKDMSLRKPFLPDAGLSFLNDDTCSLFEDDDTSIDPDSPLTPLDPGFRPPRQSQQSSGFRYPSSEYPNSQHGISKPTILKNDSYSQAMAGSREMTLRMTLTRPDLRADEKTLYGWQTSNRKAPIEEPMGLSDLDDGYGTMMKGPFGGADGWGEKEEGKGVVKRFWNRVKSSSGRSS
ncbi:hypothetical protein B7494_g6361 [Chlorociboria aeruginascens]|nr:hypothetical protein B7494_g6361 [Chlorociboria aeruginascens]